MVWRTKDHRVEVRVVRMDQGEAYRITTFPGRYHGGDYRTTPQLIVALGGLGVDIADLVEIDSND